MGFVSIGRPELDDQREDILRLYPWTKGLVSIVCRMNREPVRSPARSVANLEFHHTGERINEVARSIVAALEAEGHRAVNPAMGFPMEMDRFPGKIWVVAHKPVAVAAGLGQMGIHRNVIHPKFGNFILLATILVDAEISEEGSRLDYNPCLECKLCVAACPVGAIGADGHFDFSACYTHNYREFLGGFGDWVEKVAESRDALDYRRRVSDSETASVWQSLGFGPNYKAAYCMAVCPAGEDVIGPFLDDRKGFLKTVVDPLQAEGGDALRGPRLGRPGLMRRSGSRTRGPSRSATGSGPARFAASWRACPTSSSGTSPRDWRRPTTSRSRGQEPAEATVVIRDKTIRVEEGHVGSPDLSVTADSRTWLGFLRKERSLVWALLRRKIRLKGSPRLAPGLRQVLPVLNTSTVGSLDPFDENAKLAIK